ncbi:MAG: type IV pilus twitching motility protein PilT [Eubacteriales bacterium]|nr:type IV pilus twitching motility protein PilT [Eubacteriales bacterium]
MRKIDTIINFSKEHDCSDIHITVGTGISGRRYGTLHRFDNNYSDADIIETILSMIDDEADLNAYTNGKDLDFAYESESGIRCRVNLYHQKGKYAACLRIMGSSIPKLEDMVMPQKTLISLASQPRGLVLVTGPTGSGKSTTLAAMIDYVNRTRAEHILTVEDPIEFVYKEEKSIIHQREIGTDVTSFADALRSALREDPDIILLGEMRDYETISSAITAAETGHLVFGTLHTISAAESISRIIDVFPPHSQSQIRTQLSSVLRGVISQQLLPKADGNGRVAATEILIGNDAVANLIRQDKAHQMESTMQSGQAIGMHTLNMDLARLANEGLITQETALKCSSSPTSLKFEN